MIAAVATAVVLSWAGGVPAPPGPKPPIVVSETECPNAVGCTDGETIWINPVATVETVEHERGHVFDLRVLTDANRAEFAAIIGHAWDAERFADAYRDCRLARRIYPRWRYSVGDGLIEGRRLHIACDLIRSLTPDDQTDTVLKAPNERTKHAR